MIAKRESHSDLRQCTLLKLNAREEETVLISGICMHDEKDGEHPKVCVNLQTDVR